MTAIVGLLPKKVPKICCVFTTCVDKADCCTRVGRRVIDGVLICDWREILELRLTVFVVVGDMTSEVANLIVLPSCNDALALDSGLVDG